MGSQYSLDPEHAAALCARLDLGAPRADVTRVYGGFNHKMWRLETDRHSFAVKQLSVYTNLHDPETVQHYNVSEAVAEAFARRGIPAVSALRAGPDYLQIIDNRGYLVYPWSNGVALARTELEQEHALKIAVLLASLHRADIAVPGVRKTRFDPYPTANIAPLLRRAADCDGLSDKGLIGQLDRFVRINENCSGSALVLRRRMVIGHGDMDQKNVLWGGNGEPQIIDWESARQLNPTYELINMGLDWSGISSRFDPALFIGTLSAYRTAGGVVGSEFLRASLDCILADWLTWCLYVVAVCLETDDPQRRLREAKQIDFVLPTILRLEQITPQLLDMAGAVAES